MNFCTLFDSNYIHKGIAMYLSLRRTGCDGTLYIMAMDEKCRRMLSSYGLDGVVVDCIEDIRDEDLDKARANRSRAEFCWTCGSYVTDWFIKRYSLDEIAYLDSDLMFFHSPSVIQTELESKRASVGITPHFSKDETFGKYCVQYVYFKNDEPGSAVLSWWRNECLKWCYSKLEDGRYGDQKYLERFSTIANGVCEIDNRGCGIAYWNMYDYSFLKGNRIMFGGKEYPVVFFHYSGVNVSCENHVLMLKHTFYMTEEVRKMFVEPYAGLLSEVYSRYLATDISRIDIRPVSRWKNSIKHFLYIVRNSVVLSSVRKTYLGIKYKQRKSPYSER